MSLKSKKQELAKRISSHGKSWGPGSPDDKAVNKSMDRHAAKKVKDMAKKVKC